MSHEKRTTLVTGAAGCGVVERLRKDGRKVAGTDNLRTSEVPLEWRDDFNPIQQKLTENEDLLGEVHPQKAFEGIISRVAEHFRVFLRIPA